MKIIDLVVTSVVVFTATSAQAQISKKDLVAGSDGNRPGILS
jgi:hypothetical protein